LKGDHHKRVILSQKEDEFTQTATVLRQAIEHIEATYNEALKRAKSNKNNQKSDADLFN
jgi:hypothetical protein